MERIQHVSLVVILMLTLVANPAGAGDSAVGWACTTILNEAGVPEGEVTDAFATAGRLFEGINVRIMPRPGTECHRRLVVRIISLGMAERRRAPGSALGFTSIDSDVAYVVYERVRQYACDRRYRTSAALGLVIAHELGHLLIGERGHANVGLMQASWNDDDFRRTAAGAAAFTPSDARSIRTRLLANQ